MSFEDREYNYILYLLSNTCIDTRIIYNYYNLSSYKNEKINYNYYDLISVVFVDHHTHKYNLVPYDEIIKISNPIDLERWVF